MRVETRIRVHGSCFFCQKWTKKYYNVSSYSGVKTKEELEKENLLQLEHIKEISQIVCMECKPKNLNNCYLCSNFKEVRCTIEGLTADLYDNCKYFEELEDDEI